MKNHVDIVAYLTMAWGALQLVSGLGIGGLMLTAGAGMGFVGSAGSTDTDILVIGAFYGVLGLVLLAFGVIMGAVYLFVGWSMKGRKPWARVGGIVCGAFALLSVPLGTVLGIYTIMVLLDQDVTDEFATGPALA